MVSSSPWRFKSELRTNRELISAVFLMSATREWSGGRVNECNWRICHTPRTDGDVATQKSSCEGQGPAARRNYSPAFTRFAGNSLDRFASLIGPTTRDRGQQNVGARRRSMTQSAEASRSAKVSSGEYTRVPWFSSSADAERSRWQPSDANVFETSASNHAAGVSCGGANLPQSSFRFDVVFRRSFSI